LNKPISQNLAHRLQGAATCLLQSRPAEAAGLLNAVIAERPDLADGRRLMGLALRDLGDLAGAERELYAALSLDPRSAPTAVSLSEILLAGGRAAEALDAVAAFAQSSAADLHVLTAFGAALKALARWDEAIAAYERGARAAPSSAAAEHNLAAALGDAEHCALSEAAARRALAKGLDAPETWLVLGRALVGLGRHAEAEAAYREAIRRRPDYVEALGALAQIVWMQREDVEAAVADLDVAIGAYPSLQGLKLKKAELLDFAGYKERAYQALAASLERTDAEPAMHVIAARLSMWGDAARALRHAELAAGATPDDPVALGTLCEALLAVGDIAGATAAAADLHRRAPLDQHAIGLMATAWRLAGDDRYGRLYDRALVRASRIDAPEGWPSLDAFLADLAESLAPLHKLRTHPVGQSVRQGSQTTQNLTLSEDPVIRAFFKAIDRPIRDYLRALGPGDDLVRSRNLGDYAFNGAWSVRLRADGFHADHLHPRGWLSSAFYVALPQAIETGREGWLRFGQPGVPTVPPLEPEHFVKPEPGLLVLFPSYTWHGTVPFSGDEPRLTIAFDVVPS
jgi:tetratricopeptide (TPR) repeat protein